MSGAAKKKPDMTAAGSTVDLASVTVRELNRQLHAVKAGSAQQSWHILNPRGQHAIAAGLNAPIAVISRGLSDTTARG